MTNKVEITVLNEALIDQVYLEGSEVNLWGGISFMCKDGYMTAVVSAKQANALVREGRVLRVKLLDV